MLALGSLETHGREAENVGPKKYLVKKVLVYNFWTIWCKQLKIYLQTSIEPKYGAFYMNNKVTNKLKGSFPLALGHTKPVQQSFSDGV